MSLDKTKETILEEIRTGISPRMALTHQLDNILDKEQRHFVLIHPPSIPSVQKMMEIIPEEERPSIESFEEALARELAVMASYSSGAKEPYIGLSTGRVAGSQYIFEFEVKDLKIPVKDTINWHGQNTSQWLYAGCILVQRREVTTHH